MRTLQRATPFHVLDHRFEVQVRFVAPRVELGLIAGVLLELMADGGITRSETLRSVCTAFDRNASWRPASK